MSEIKDRAIRILNVAKNIYQVQEKNNPNLIFGNKIFLIGNEDDPEAVWVKRDYEEKDSSYYFETSEIEGVIVKRENGNYCIKACVKYTNANGQNLWFAKIRLESSQDNDIQIMGTWSGSWQQPDFEDVDQTKNPNSDFPIALDSMENYLIGIFLLCENSELNSDLCSPAWVKKLRKYNN